jgi:hypothetical protein
MVVELLRIAVKDRMEELVKVGFVVIVLVFVPTDSSVLNGIRE